MSSGAALIRHERKGRVLTVTLDSPPRNFIGRQLVAEVDALLRKVERDRSLGAVVITSAHPTSFITHWDVDEMLAGVQATPDIPYRLVAPYMRATGLIARIPGGTAL